MDMNVLKNLYYLRYKQGNQGVQSSLIIASTPSSATEVGKAFCSQQLNRRFIRIDPAIVADESILGPASGPPAEPQDVANNNAVLSELTKDTGAVKDVKKK